MASQFSHSIRLKIKGGGVLDVHGALDANPLFLILGRDDFMKEDAFTSRLIGHLVDRSQTVLWYESGTKNTQRILNSRFPSTLPKALRWFVKICWVCLHPTRWSFFYRPKEKIPFRCESLIALLKFLGPEREVILLTRSANGRVASRVADGTGIQKIVCLGYPFQHPGCEMEPSRFDHLPTLRTPLLIIQGIHDPYGGKEIRERYTFSPQTTVRFVETDHDFRVSEALREEIFAEIDAFIFPQRSMTSS
jgi:uncharacterized protein